jgi:hypothetical protein
MRQKIFGIVAVPLDREAKVRLLFRARALMRSCQKGKHYGPITAKHYAVLCAILMQFHGPTGRAFPSYDAIQKAAGCSRATVAAALRALEAARILRVYNRLVRVRWRDPLAMVERTKVCRTSNCYAPVDPGGSPKFKLQGGTRNQVFNPDLLAALDRLQKGIRGGNRKNCAMEEGG